MGDVGKSQSKTNGKLSPLLKTKSFYDNNAKKINGRRPKYHNRSTSKGAIKLNDSVTQESAPNVNQESSSDDCKILQQKLNNPSIINLPARANARPSGSDISQNSGKNRKRAASLTHTENSSLSVKEFSPPVAQAAKNLRKRTYNPSEVIAKLNKQLILSGHKFSERQIELIENQISEERRELMKIYRQLIAQKKKHQQLLQEDTKIENILDKEKSQEIQSFMPKQKLQKIESEIFLATISGPNYDESVRSYKDYIAAISISTYPVLGGVRAGDPICDFYYARLFEQGTIFALADGCNWGEAPKQAAQRAANTFVHYIQDRLYRLSDTKQVTKEILKAFAASHGAIMMGSGDTDFFHIGTATLIGGALLPLAPKPKTESTTISSSHSADPLPESNVSLESKNLNSPQKRRRRKTAELPQISNSISKQEDFVRPVIPKSRRKHRKSSGGSMLKNITSTNELQLKLDPTPAPISTKPQPRSGEFGSAPELYLLSELDPILVESPRESAPARSKRKKCMRKLSPRRNSEEPPNTQQMIVNSENPESNTTVSSSDSSAKTNTSDNPLSTPNSNSNSNDNNAQSPVDSGLGEQEDTLQKSILSPVIRNSEEREWSPLSNRRRSSRKVSISPEVAQSPGRHRSCTHYGYAGLNDRATNTSPVMDVSKSDGTNDWAFVFGSVGDCKVFLFNPTDQTVTDITSSNRSNSMSAADCGGRLGPCDKSGKPDLRNLSVVSATVQEGDLIILVSDGVHDNLDPELLGKTPFELSSLVNEKATWDDIPVEEATSLKNTFREQKLAELLNQLPTRTPKNICKTLANYAKGITQSSRTFMETNPALELPSDFTKYPGKMDHTSCICIQVGSRSNRSDINLVRDAFIRKETMSITHN